MYFVYVYVFDDGSIYIGRTSDTQNRFGNASKYSGQEVYKHMCNQKFEQVKLLESENPITVCYVEHELINIPELYNISHNASLEDNWLAEAVKLIKCDINDMHKCWHDFYLHRYNIDTQISGCYNKIKELIKQTNIRSLV